MRQYLKKISIKKGKHLKHEKVKKSKKKLKTIFIRVKTCVLKVKFGHTKRGNQNPDIREGKQYNGQTKETKRQAIVHKTLHRNYMC